MLESLSTVAGRLAIILSSAGVDNSITINCDIELSLTEDGAKCYEAHGLQELTVQGSNDGVDAIQKV